MRILMVAPQFRPMIGGYERAAERLSIALAINGHNVTVVSERRQRAWPAVEQIEGIKIRRLPCVYKPHFHLFSSLATFLLFLLIRGRKFQVWHVHQYGTHAALAILLGKMLRRPVVLKLTSSGSHGLQQATDALPMAGALKGWFRKVDAIVALTRETRKEAVAFGVETSRVHVLGNGVDVQEFRPCEQDVRSRNRKDLGIDASGVVLFVGRLSKEKNPDGLIDAWSMAISGMPAGWKLVIVGDGPMYAELKKLIYTRSLENNVVLAGYQSNISTWMSAADIYVLASHREGLSNTLLEAMASGLPTISTRVSGSEEVLEETGAGDVVEVGIMDQFATRLVDLASDRARRIRMGRAAREVIERTYSIESVADRHVALYTALVYGNKLPHCE